MDSTNFKDIEQLAKSHEELSAQVIALTTVVGAMATKSSIDYERLEDCVHFAARRLRPGWWPIIFEKAALILKDLEALQKVIEGWRTRTLTDGASQR